jgi:AcrR family transcriptional regulator
MSSQKASPNHAELPASLPRMPKQARSKQRVMELLDAGAAVFAEKGYDAATMTEIAARAHAAIGSLYQFFPSKDALAEALLRRYAEGLAKGLDQLAARAALLPPRSLAAQLVGLMVSLSADRAAAIILVDARSDGPQQRTAMRDAARAHLARILLIANRNIPAARAPAMAVILLQLLKAVPTLAAEDETVNTALLQEMRDLIELYVVSTRTN